MDLNAAARRVALGVNELDLERDEELSATAFPAVVFAAHALACTETGAFSLR